MSSRARRSVAVVGGGISGLVTAYRIRTADPNVEVVVCEAGDAIGGKLRNVSVGGLDLPAGADSFVARKPWAVDLCRELGIELAAPGTTGAYLWTDTGLVAMLPDAPFGIPGDVGDVLRWPGLSRAGRRRALGDLVRSKRKDDADETLGGLLRRRLGDEATDLAVGPLLAGLFAGDVDLLSAGATFPELQSWEREQGSLIRGSQAARRRAGEVGTPGPMFARPRDGVQRLAEALAERLNGVVRVAEPVGSVLPSGPGWRLDTPGGPLEVDGVVLAVPGPACASLLEAGAPTVSREIGAIPHVSTGVVLMVYPRGTHRAISDGTGFVVPRGRAPMTACTWVSSKWPDESFDTRAVVRCYVGAAGEEDILEADDAELIEACARHLAAVVALPEEPEHASVVRWPASMPQYEVGHLERVARIRGSLPPGIFVVGQATDGVGIPDCVRGAGETAEAVLAYLAGVPTIQETKR